MASVASAGGSTSSALAAGVPSTSARKIKLRSWVDGSIEPKYFSISRWISRVGEVLKVSSISMTARSSGVAKRMTNGDVGISSTMDVFLMYYATITTVMVVFYVGAAKWRH